MHTHTCTHKSTSILSLRELFNAAIPRFNAALEYYKLDGWVTEHVTAQLEVSNAYRCVCVCVSSGGVCVSPGIKRNMYL